MDKPLPGQDVVLTVMSAAIGVILAVSPLFQLQLIGLESWFVVVNFVFWVILSGLCCSYFGISLVNNLWGFSLFWAFGLVAIGIALQLNYPNKFPEIFIGDQLTKMQDVVKYTHAIFFSWILANLAIFIVSRE